MGADRSRKRNLDPEEGMDSLVFAGFGQRQRPPCRVRWCRSAAADLLLSMTFVRASARPVGRAIAFTMCGLTVRCRLQV